MNINVIDLGKVLYQVDRRAINYRFVLVFAVRWYLNKKECEGLVEFLGETPFREELFKVHPNLFAQLTRQFFYRGSTTAERYALITGSVREAEKLFTAEALEKFYLHKEKPCRLMEFAQPSGAERNFTVEMYFHEGEVREGLLALYWMLDGRAVYHVNFWLEDDGGPVIAVGCHQGSKEGLALNKELTKAFFGYRPKNLIIFFLRILAQEIGAVKIKAVSNYGHYANNHIRSNRKLLVSYDDFWEECGGEVTADKRFYTIPLLEPRKTMEEVPTRKRAVYRKRFAFLDELEAKFRRELQRYLRTK